MKVSRSILCCRKPLINCFVCCQAAEVLATVNTLTKEKNGGSQLLTFRFALNLVMHLINILEIVNLASRLLSQS